MAKFTPLVRRSLHEELAQSLEQLILSGELSSGEMLPSEQALGEQFGVSRAVVRDAVRILAARGLVIARHGVGTVVTHSGRPGYLSALMLHLQRADATLGELAIFRSMLEPEVAAEAARQASAKDKQTLGDVVKAYVTLVTEGKLAEAEEVHLKFHLMVLQITHNRVLEALIDPITEIILATYFDNHVGEVKPDTSIHMALFEAITSNDPEAARIAMRRHFEYLESPTYQGWKNTLLKDAVAQRLGEAGGREPAHEGSLR